MSTTVHPPAADPVVLTGKALVKKLRQIRDSYEDGVPLRREDRKVVLAALRQHPRGKAKFGSGIREVKVGHNGLGRCFFVVRADSTTVDFSIYKCAGFAGSKPDWWKKKTKKKPAPSRAAALAERDGAAIRAWVAQVVTGTGTGPSWRETAAKFGWEVGFSKMIKLLERDGWITTGAEPRSMRPGRRTR